MLVNCGDYSTALGPGGYHRFTVEPGEVLCTSQSENSAQVQLRAEAGHDYYIRQWLGMGFFLPHVFLDSVSADEAQPEIQTCNRQ